MKVYSAAKRKGTHI